MMEPQSRAPSFGRTRSKSLEGVILDLNPSLPSEHPLLLSLLPLFISPTYGYTYFPFKEDNNEVLIGVGVFGLRFEKKNRFFFNDR